jgi:tetratricopeptide (TPR) repeat protein
MKMHAKLQLFALLFLLSISLCLYSPSYGQPFGGTPGPRPGGGFSDVDPDTITRVREDARKNRTTTDNIQERFKVLKVLPVTLLRKGAPVGQYFPMSKFQEISSFMKNQDYTKAAPLIDTAFKNLDTAENNGQSGMAQMPPASGQIPPPRYPSTTPSENINQSSNEQQAMNSEKDQNPDNSKIWLGCALNHVKGNSINDYGSYWQVVYIYEDSPAEKAGIQVNDIILKYDNHDYDVTEFEKYKEQLTAGSKIVLTIKRNNDKFSLPLVLEERHYILTSQYLKVKENHSLTLWPLSIMKRNTDSGYYYVNNLCNIQGMLSEGFWQCKVDSNCTIQVIRPVWIEVDGSGLIPGYLAVLNGTIYFSSDALHPFDKSETIRNMLYIVSSNDVFSTSVPFQMKSNEKIISNNYINNLQEDEKAVLSNRIVSLIPSFENGYHAIGDTSDFGHDFARFWGYYETGINYLDRFDFEKSYYYIFKVANYKFSKHENITRIIQEDTLNKINAIFNKVKNDSSNKLGLIEKLRDNQKGTILLAQAKKYYDETHYDAATVLLVIILQKYNKYNEIDNVHKLLHDICLVYYQKSELGTALNLVNLILNFEPSNTDAQSLKDKIEKSIIEQRNAEALLKYQKGLENFKTKDYISAYFEFRNALQLNPNLNEAIDKLIETRKVIPMEQINSLQLAEEIYQPQNLNMLVAITNPVDYKGTIIKWTGIVKQKIDDKYILKISDKIMFSIDIINTRQAKYNFIEGTPVTVIGQIGDLETGITIFGVEKDILNVKAYYVQSPYN